LLPQPVQPAVCPLLLQQLFPAHTPDAHEAEVEQSLPSKRNVVVVVVVEVVVMASHLRLVRAYVIAASAAHCLQSVPPLNPT
jgi:hypothetical protein